MVLDKEKLANSLVGCKIDGVYGEHEGKSYYFLKQIKVVLANGKHVVIEPHQTSEDGGYQLSIFNVMSDAEIKSNKRKSLIEKRNELKQKADAVSKEISNL